MANLTKTIYGIAGDSDAYGKKIFFTLLIILLGVFLGKILRMAVRKITPKEKVRYKLNKTIYYLMIFLTSIGILYTWFNALEGLAAGISILLALGVFAMKDLVLNLAGFVYLSLKHPFDVGDRIEINGIKGDVTDIDFFKFKVAETGNWLKSEDHTGRSVLIPNQDVFTNAIANFSKEFPYIWKDITIPISHESNLEKAMEMAQSIGKEMLFQLVHEDQADDEKKKDLDHLGNQVELFDGNILPKVHVRVDGHSTYVILRYLGPYKGIVEVETEIWKRILERILEEPDLELSPDALWVTRK